MADLESLIRLRRHTVEEKQKILADIYREVEICEHQKMELNERLERERAALDENLDLETREFYGRFEGVIREKIDNIDAELKSLETRLELAQEEVRSAFADMKRVEIVNDRRTEEERLALIAKETAELDEIGLEGFRRKEEF